MPSGAFTNGITLLNNGTRDLLTDNLIVALMRDTYVYNPDSDNMSDIVANEITVAGYSRSANLAGKAVTPDDATNRCVFDATDPAAFTSLAAGQTIAGAVVMYDSGADATRTLIAYCELDVAIPTNGGNFTLTFNSAGIVRWQM